MGVIIPQPSSENRAAGGQRVEGSSIFDGSKSYHLKRSFGPSDGTKKTFSFWVKRGKLGTTQCIFSTDVSGYIEGRLAFLSSDIIQITDRDGADGSTDADQQTTAAFRDPSEFFHIVFAYDTPNGTGGDRMRLYIDGVEQTDFGSDTNPAQDYVTSLFRGGAINYIGCNDGSDFLYANLTQIYYIDGEALAPTEFGYTDPLTGKWRPKKYTGDYNVTRYNTTDATGGNTILNTNATGSTIESGYRTDSSAGTTANQGLVLAWPGNVVDGDVHDHINTGSSAKTVTAENNAALSTTQSKFYGTSGYVNGSSDSFRVTDHADLALGSGDYTVEFWFRPDSIFSNFVMYDGRHPTTGWPSSAGGFSIISNAEGVISTYTSGAYVCQTSAGALAPNAWNHIAIVRNSGTQKIYVNGVEKASASNTTNHTEQKCNIGNAANDGEGSKGYYNDFRIYKGTAKYTSAFNPPMITAGACSFYLPFDGSAPIGQDQSPIGNNWTPVNFGGNASVDKATGGLPILNTTQGGSQSTGGARGSVGVAVTVYNDGGGDKFYLDDQKQGTVKFVPGQTVTFDTGDSTVATHPFRLSANWDGSHTSYSSVDFDGVDSVLQYSNDVGFNFGTGAFTIEFWARVEDVSQDHAAVVSLYLFGGGPFIKLRTSNEWSLYFNKDGGGNDTHNICGIGTYNEWHHLAWVREGTGTNETKLYFDGTKVYEATYPTDIVGDNSAGHGLTIGKMQPSGGSTYFEGKLRDVRISKGVARYTSNFCPPNEPLTVDGNTSILVCNTSTTTDVSGNYTGVATAIGGVTSGTSENPFKEYVFGTANTGISEGTVGAATTITIPYNAPGELTYYCTSHTGMGGTVSIGATDPNVADPYASKCVLAVPGTEKPDFDQSDLVNCTTPKKSCSESGLAPNRKRSNFYGNSIYFDNSNDYGEFTGTDEWQFGKGNYTAEVWVYNTDQGDQYACATYSNVGSTWWGINLWSNGGSNNTIRAGLNARHDVTLQWQNDRWYHIAVSREAGTSRLFLDGVVIDSKADTDDILATNSTTLQMGRDANSWSLWYGGYMQDLRVYKGISKYNKNFIPASALPDVIPDVPSGISNESELEQVSSGSLTLGTTDAADYLEIPDDTSLDFETGDWSIEGWIYPLWTASGASNYAYVFNKGVDFQVAWMDTNGGTIAYFVEDGAGGYHIHNSNITGTGSVPVNKWSHLAFTRSGDIWRVFVNGRLKYQETITGGITNNATNFTIGTYLPNPTNYEFYGYISNVRLVKGQPVYTKEFIPSDIPLTTTSQGVLAANCSLLCCQNLHKAHYAAKSPNTIISHGNAAASWFNPFADLHETRGQETEYATLSPNNTMDTNATFSDGKLQAQITGPCTVASSIPMYSGKWYCEIINTTHASVHMGIGISKIECCDGNRQPDENQHRGGWSFWHISGDGSYHKAGYGASWGSLSTTWNDWAEQWGSNGSYDVMGLALDMDNRKLDYYKNGRNIGTPENGLTRTIDWGTLIDATSTILPNTTWAAGDHGMVFVIGNGQSGVTSDFEVNFGQKPWKYAPPAGYRGCTVSACNPRPTLVRPDKEYFTPVMYTGEDSSNTSGTGNDWGIPVDVGFTPDLVMLKSRTQTYGWYVFDTIRKGDKPSGTAVPGADLECYDWFELNDSDASTNSAYNNGIGIRHNGFNVDIGGQGVGEAGQGADNMIAYCFKAGGYKGTWNKDGEDVSNYTNAGLNYGDTSILNACSINTKAGFSMVKWTQDSGGASKNIAHGLSKAPSFVIMKHVNNSSSWYTVHTGIETEGKILYTESNSQQDSSSDFGSVWPGATYTATSTTGVSGRQLVLYSWTNTEGVQKFGQYEGNGSTSKGIYVHLGFRPAILWIKRTDSSGDWYLWDNKRETNNARQNIIKTNNYHGEDISSTIYLDFLDDGFKLYNSAGDVNNGGSKYLYMAWADVPTSVMYGS